MKTFVPFMKLLCAAALFLIVISSAALAQSGGVLLTNGLSFTDPELVTHRNTDKKAGAVYLFEDVAPGIDARLHIDSLVNNARIITIDDNSKGLGYKAALQPEVGSGNVYGKSYAVFTITFYEAGTTTIKALQTVNATALDIDGNNRLREFAELRMGDGGSASYMSTTLDISLKDLSHGKFRAENIRETERDGIDTLSYANMFTAKNNGISSFSITYGTIAENRTTDSRQFSLYMKGFSYPDEVILPVELVSFSAELNGKKAELKWVTATEKNVSHFVVEKSLDGRTYEDAGIVFAMGNSSQLVNYSFTDKNINIARAGIIYYRLRSVDIDTRSEYSQVRIIRTGTETSKAIAILTYPNPVTNELRVTVPDNWQGKKVSYEVLNNNGRLSIRTGSGSSSQTETINVSSLAPGVYLVRVSCNGEAATQKIVKQ